MASEVPFDIVCDSRDRDAWLQARRATIGASEAAVVLGCSPWSSRIALWADKTGRTERDAEHEAAEYLFWGQQLEPAIIEGFGRRTGRWTIPFGLLLRSRTFPWLSATPDALCTDDPKAAENAVALRRAIQIAQAPELLLELSAGWWPLQTKNIGFFSADHWQEGVPSYYRVQCVQEALVFGARLTTGAALIGGQRLVWDDVVVDQDIALERQIVHLTRRFVEQHVEADVEPAADGSQSARSTLSTLYPRETRDKALHLDANWMDEADEYDRYRQAAKDIEAQTRLFENKVRQEMKDAESAVLPDGSGFTLKCTSTGTRRLLRKKARGE